MDEGMIPQMFMQFDPELIKEQREQRQAEEAEAERQFIEGSKNMNSSDLLDLLEKRVEFMQELIEAYENASQLSAADAIAQRSLEASAQAISMAIWWIEHRYPSTAESESSHLTAPDQEDEL